MVQKSGEAGHSEEERSENLTDEELKVAQEAGKAALESVDSDEIDDLLDEIDDVLETNAEDFVKSFIQKGGQ